MTFDFLTLNYYSTASVVCLGFRNRITRAKLVTI